MDKNHCNELTKKLNIQPSTSSEKSLEKKEDGKCKINIFADIVPILSHDCYNSTNFHDWRKLIEPVTNAYPLTCESKEEAIKIMNIERERLLELVWCEKEQFQRLLLTELIEERKWKVLEQELEQKLFWKRMQLEGCRKRLQDVQEQFDEYKSEVVDEPLEEPEWLDELLNDN